MSLVNTTWSDLARKPMPAARTAPPATKPAPLQARNPARQPSREIIKTMLNGVRQPRALALVALMAALGCHAQTPAQPSAQASAAESVQVGVPLSPATARRIEVMIRNKADIGADYVFSFNPPTRSEVPGYYTVAVNFATPGKSPKSATFLLSDDGKTLAQFNKFDISEDPRDKISSTGRPARGGPANAPVVIVGFDDLECPYCAMMNAELFPAILNRYKDQVRIVYRDFPLEEIHPWAKHAAVDANCLASESGPGYWNFVDYVHAHAADMAGTEKTADKANQNLDKLVLDEGTRQKVDQSKLVACVLKQDSASVNQSILQGEADPLRLNQAPVLFVNGEKVDGVVPIDTLYRIIDRALIAAGQTPPPPQPAPATTKTPTPAPAKPGS
jgi:protein-disulfide isomerase